MKTSSHSQDIVRLQARERRVSKRIMLPTYIRMQTKALMQQLTVERTKLRIRPERTHRLFSLSENCSSIVK